MAQPDRKGGSGLSLRTLAIASAASLTAAMVAKRFFPPGTIYASAFTPIIVAAVSEMLNRPAERVSEFRRQRRTLVVEAQRQRVAHGESTPLGSDPRFAEDEELSGNGVPTAPLLIERRPRRRLRDIHPKVWVATGLAAFVIAVAVLTLPELIFGGAVASNSRTTFFGGGSGQSTQSQKQTSTTPASTQTQTTTTVTQTVTTPTTTGTATSTTPTSTDTTTSTTPGGGTPAPTVTTPTTTTGP